MKPQSNRNQLRDWSWKNAPRIQGKKTKKEEVVFRRYFSRYLSQLRKKAGLTQPLAAEAANVDLKTFQNWEAGRTAPEQIDGFANFISKVCQKIGEEIDAQNVWSEMHDYTNFVFSMEQGIPAIADILSDRPEFLPERELNDRYLQWKSRCYYAGAIDLYAQRDASQISACKIGLRGDDVSGITFRIRTKARHFRVGVRFKDVDLCSRSTSPVANSGQWELVVYLGRNNGRNKKSPDILFVSTYNCGKPAAAIRDLPLSFASMDNAGSGDIFDATVTMRVVSSKIAIYIGILHIYDYDIHPDLLSDVSLVAWSDDKPFRVRIDRIGISTTSLQRLPIVSNVSQGE